ncbi:arginase [Algoriphagus sp. 4150]|uniref:arginase family protein n=1 Tax=Algoriphagus sp. 4150 TaxID=2817756 RepID=UPI00285CDDF4|nr:arginase family protein [Algoriphagus sp. 4150]MDR7131498.1 arginase [Algoriphagus sp. 4150]
MKKATIVECPSNLGLKEPYTGKEPGVKSLPNFLNTHSFHSNIGPESIIKLVPPKYSNVKDPETGILNADSIVEYSIYQAKTIRKLLEDKKLALIIGGDCSIMLGSAIALKQTGNYALFYLDGHTDFMDISLSETGGVGGLVASLVTGKGHKKMSDILNLSPYIMEENLWCVGNREYDEAYENEIRNSNAKYISLVELRKESIVKCVQAFLKDVSDKQLDGFWLHIDVDVLNDGLMPCVDSRTQDGLTYAEFNELTYMLFQSDKLSGFEITILDPDLDSDGKYTSEFVFNITSTFNRAIRQ